ncbi:MAG: protein kinase [Planctomycetota bacterium]
MSEPTGPTLPADGDPEDLTRFLAAARKKTALPAVPADVRLGDTDPTRSLARTILRATGDPPAGVPAAVEAAKADASRLLGRFVRMQSLGRGGMGEVFQAWDPSLDRVVALKVIRTDGGHVPELRQRFLREARLAARLRHPHLVTVFEVGEAADTPYIAMEFIPGGTLDQRIPKARRDVVILFRGVCEAVGYAHSQGIVHRDLKPGNILVDGDGAAFVSDFGIAKDVTHGGMTATGDVLGTLGYMSPEQAAGQRITPASDVFSLGVILYELLAGCRPFTAEDPRSYVRLVWESDPVPLRRFDASVPQELEWVCLRALEKEATRRYPSGRELAEDLARWLDGEPVLARPATLWRRVEKTVRRHRAVSAAASVAIVALAGLGLWTGLRTHWQRRDAAELYALGCEARSRGDLGAALAHFAQASRLRPEYAEAASAAAAAQAELRAREERARSLARARAIGLRVEEMLRDVDDLRSRMGMEPTGKFIERAGALCAQMEAVAPGSAEALYARGRWHEARGEWDLAAARMREAVDADATFATAWFHLGIDLQERAWAGRRLGPPLAIAPGRESFPVLQLPPPNGEAVAWRAESGKAFREVLARSDPSIDELMTNYAQAVIAELEGSGPKSTDLYFELLDEPGWISDRSIVQRATIVVAIEPAESAEHLMMLYQARPWRTDLARFCATACLLAGDQETYEAVLGAVRENKDEAWLLSLLEGHRHLAQDEFAEAEKAYTASIEAHPDNLDAHAGRGMVRHLQGQAKEAAADYDEVLRLGEDPGVRWNRAVLRADAGEAARAREDLAAILSGWPDGEFAQHAKTLIEELNKSPR